MPDLFGVAEKAASLSPCGRYRWSLSRAWDSNLLKPWLGFVMLNPSVADADIDDPTIRRCVGFAKTLGFAGVSVRNLFAVRATDPDALYSDPDPVGPENDRAILELVGGCPVVVAAWGVHGHVRGRARQVIDLLAARGQALHCLGVTKGGHPRHPLYLRADAELRPYPLVSE